MERLRQRRVFVIWILENDDMIMRSAQILAANVYKAYRAYEKPL